MRRRLMSVRCGMGPVCKSLIRKAEIVHTERISEE